MEVAMLLFNEVLIRPLFNLLVLVYQILPVKDFGVAIILVTIFTRLLLYPLSHKALRSQKMLTELQPKIKEIQKKFKEKKEEQAREVMALYKKHSINPFAGCVPILIQLPILIALYQVFLTGLETDALRSVYSFISAPEAINPFFLGFINLAVASPPLAVLAGLAQFFQSKITFSQKQTSGGSPKEKGTPDFQKMMGRQMTYVMPFFTTFIAWKFPAGLPLYWMTTMLFSFGQQYIINKSVSKEDFLQKKDVQ